jgi:hypothetical protein
VKFIVAPHFQSAQTLMHPALCRGCAVSHVQLPVLVKSMHEEHAHALLCQFCVSMVSGCPLARVMTRSKGQYSWQDPAGMSCAESGRYLLNNIDEYIQSWQGLAGMSCAESGEYLSTYITHTQLNQIGDTGKATIGLKRLLAP